MKISQLFLGLVACSTAFAYAGIDGISSNESNIKIGAAANASHTIPLLCKCHALSFMA